MKLILCYTLFSVLLLAMTDPTQAKEAVVLLHGLARTSQSMHKMERALSAEGYVVLNLDYPSRKETVQALAASVRKQVDALALSADKVHFVTHSMGGILVRQMQKTAPIEKLGRVVMLSPPNQGSEVVTKLSALRTFQWLNGPAGQQLGTEINGFIARLGPVDFELGVITGDHSINWINSCMIPGKDDGKVSTESAKVAGMRVYRIAHTTHPYIMKNKKVIADTVEFLKTGALLDI